MNTGNPLYFRTSSRMENKNTVESIHCFTGKNTHRISLLVYLQSLRTMTKNLGRVSLTLISLRLDWPTCALSHEIKSNIQKKGKHLFLSNVWLLASQLSTLQFHFPSGSRELFTFLLFLSFFCPFHLSASILGLSLLENKGTRY